MQIMFILNRFFRKSKEPNQYLVTKVVQLLKDKIENSFPDTTEVDIFISELKNIDNRKNYSQLINIFENVKRNIIKKDQEYLDYYYKEYHADVALGDVLSILSDSENGVKGISWTMKNEYKKTITQRFLAYNIDSETWELLKMYIKDSIGNEEGYTFECYIDPDISKLVYPYCNCTEVSETIIINGNHISADCDTYGTVYGVKAKSLYAFYVTDLNKYAVVNSSYYVY